MKVKYAAEKPNEINYCTTQLLERESDRFLGLLSGGILPGTLITSTSDVPDFEFSRDRFRCMSAVRVSFGLARLTALSPLRILAVFAVVLVLFTDCGRSLC